MGVGRRLGFGGQKKEKKLLTARRAPHDWRFEFLFFLQAQCGARSIIRPRSRGIYGQNSGSVILTVTRNASDPDLPREKIDGKPSGRERNRDSQR